MVENWNGVLHRNKTATLLRTERPTGAARMVVRRSAVSLPGPRQTLSLARQRCEGAGQDMSRSRCRVTAPIRRLCPGHRTGRHRPGRSQIPTNISRASRLSFVSKPASSSLSILDRSQRLARPNTDRNSGVITLGIGRHGLRAARTGGDDPDAIQRRDSVAAHRLQNTFPNSPGVIG